MLKLFCIAGNQTVFETTVNKYLLNHKVVHRFMIIIKVTPLSCLADVETLNLRDYDVKINNGYNK